MSEENGQRERLQTLLQDSHWISPFWLLTLKIGRKNRFSESLKSLIPEEKEDYANEVTILH